MGSVTSAQVLPKAKSVEAQRTQYSYYIVSQTIKNFMQYKNTENKQKYPKIEHTFNAVHTIDIQTGAKIQILQFQQSTKTEPGIWEDLREFRKANHCKAVCKSAGTRWKAASDI